MAGINDRNVVDAVGLIVNRFIEVAAKSEFKVGNTSGHSNGNIKALIRIASRCIMRIIVIASYACSRIASNPCDIGKGSCAVIDVPS